MAFRMADTGMMWTPRLVEANNSIVAISRNIFHHVVRLRFANLPWAERERGGRVTKTIRVNAPKMTMGHWDKAPS